MKYSRPAHTVAPDNSFWYYITFHKDEEDLMGTRMFLAASVEDPYWYNLDIGEETLNINVDEINAVFAKYFAKIDGGLDWYT